MAMPLPGDIAIQAPGDLGQAPWARWPRAGPGVAVGSHRLHGAPGAGLSCGGSWEGNDSQGDMVPSAVRGVVAVTRGSVVTSQTRGLGGGRRLPAHTSLRTQKAPNWGSLASRPSSGRTSVPLPVCAVETEL